MLFRSYKVLSATDPDDFLNKKWQLMDMVNPNDTSKDQLDTIELIFAPSVTYQTSGINTPSGLLSYSENGVTYPLGGTFKHFAIKLVLFADDATVPPIVKTMRAIATPSG